MLNERIKYMKWVVRSATVEMCSDPDMQWRRFELTYRLR